jgi:hypothetical protein
MAQANIEDCAHKQHVSAYIFAVMHAGIIIFFSSKLTYLGAIGLSIEQKKDHLHLQMVNKYFPQKLPSGPLAVWL